MDSGDWVSVAGLAEILKVTKRAIQLNIKHGKYPTAHQVAGNGNGRGGKIWLINIGDPGIPPEIRTQYYKDLTKNQDTQKNESLAVPDGIKALAVSPMPVATSCISPLSDSQGQNGLPVPGCLSMETEQNTSVGGSPAADRGKVYPSGPSATPCGPPGHGESGKSLVPCGNYVEQAQIGTMPAPATFSEKAKKVAVARVDLVRAWREYRKNHQSRMDANEEFQDGYNGGLIQENLHDVLGNVSIKTLYRWHGDLGGTSDWTRLIPLTLNKKEKGSQLSKDEQDIFLKIVLSPRKLKIETAARLTREYLKNKGVPSSASPRTFRRFIEKYKTKNNHIWVLTRYGQKALRDKVLPFIKRDPSLLDVGQVLVADGHRLNFQIISPFTGKPCRAVLVGFLDWKSFDLCGYEIMLEEDTQCIASALRNSIIRLGKIPQFTYQDNGKAFRSRFFTSTDSLEEIGIYGLFGRLGITAIFAHPYNARAKIIERWFKEFSNTFERLMPSFTGASIEDKPAWLLRNEPFHKAIHKEYIPTFEEAIELIDIWLEWHRGQSCPHVTGKTIGEVFNEGKGPGVNIRDLDDLMMAIEEKNVDRNRIRFLKNDYHNEALFGLREKVIIRYDRRDLSYIKVYSKEGEYLCTADRAMSLHPLAQHLGTTKDMEALKQALSLQKRLEKKTIQSAKEHMKLRKNIELNWERVINVNPRIVERLEKENIVLPETVERIPDEALKPKNKEKKWTPIEVDRSISKRSIPLAEFFKRLIAEIGPISKALNQSLRSQYGESIEISQAEEVIRNCGSSRPLFESEIERYQWHLVNGFRDEEDVTSKEKFIQTDAYRLGFKFFDDQKMRIKKEEESAAAAQL